MTHFDRIGDRTAIGAPRDQQRRTGAAKDAIGTAYSASSRLWYTVSRGIVSEIHFPRIDRPQTRELGLLITDGQSFLHEEKRDLEHRVECLAPGVPGFRITSADRAGRYRIVKQIIADPRRSVLLMHVKLKGRDDFLERLRLYVLWAPSVGGGGSVDNVEVTTSAGRRFLTAHRNGVWSALAATSLFRRCSCGHAGESEGWTDLNADFPMAREFRCAPDGDVALTGEIDLRETRRFTLGLAFGDNLHSSAANLLQSLDAPFQTHRKRFLKQWKRACSTLAPLESASGDNGELYRLSCSLLLGHEDKLRQGAMASLSVPWSPPKATDDSGEHPLVWARNLYNTVTGLMAAGKMETARAALINLACAQREDGDFHQNWCVTGISNWSGAQIQNAAFAILLAWRLHQAGAFENFDPYPMVFRAAAFLMRHGPVAPQEGWEDNSGLSPSILASNIAALTCASGYAREKGDAVASELMQAFADFLECHVEAWTVTSEGTLLHGVARHYVRLNPIDPTDPHADEGLEGKTVSVRDAESGARRDFPTTEIVDAGFLELVRYGVRRAGTKLMEDSLRVVDAVLKAKAPAGPAWGRERHDGCGRRFDGRACKGPGLPLLAGERAHYELAAGRSAAPFIKAIEGLRNSAGLLPEQVGGCELLSTGRERRDCLADSAMPLAWAHAEYIKLLRSVRDGAVFDLIPAVAKRYALGGALQPVEFWTFRRQITQIDSDARLFVLGNARFDLRWTSNAWGDQNTSPAVGMGGQLWFVELPTIDSGAKRFQFSFFWPESARWEGRDFAVEVRSDG